MRYSGRDFTPEEITLIRELTAEDPARTRAELSRMVCRILKRYKHDGGLKDMSCRAAMLRMHDDGLIVLPPPRCKRPQADICFTSAADPGPAVCRPVHELGPLQLSLAANPADSRLWNEYVRRYHYLGCRTLPGAQLRYFVFAGDQLISLLGFGASARQCAPRDSYIGWSHDRRQKSLHLIVNNARFLILPWIHSKNPASKILALSVKIIPTDWENRYGYQPVLFETFVEKGRFTGTCYKAANWRYLGETKGRGRLGPAKKISY